MGWDQHKLEVGGSVSRHNSREDKLDDALWEHFVSRVRDVVEDPQYKRLNLDVIRDDV